VAEDRGDGEGSGNQRKAEGMAHGRVLIGLRTNLSVSEPAAIGVPA